MNWTQFVILCVILISIQYTLNKILVELRKKFIEDTLRKNKGPQDV